MVRLENEDTLEATAARRTRSTYGETTELQVWLVDRSAATPAAMAVPQSDMIPRAGTRIRTAHRAAAEVALRLDTMAQQEA